MQATPKLVVHTTWVLLMVVLVSAVHTRWVLLMAVPVSAVHTTWVLLMAVLVSAVTMEWDQVTPAGCLLSVMVLATQLTGMGQTVNRMLWMAKTMTFVLMMAPTAKGSASRIVTPRCFRWDFPTRVGMVPRFCYSKSSSQ